MEGLVPPLPPWCRHWYHGPVKRHLKLLKLCKYENSQNFFYVFCSYITERLLNWQTLSSLYQIAYCCGTDWIFFFIFILLSRESDVGAMHRTNPDSLKSCFCFRVFRLSFASHFFSLLLVGFHQAETMDVKHLIQARNNEARVEV